MKIKFELVLVTCAVLLVSMILYAIPSPLIHKYLGVLVALLLLYVPFFVLSTKKRPLDFLDTSFSSYLKSFWIFLIASLIVFPLFFAAGHVWQTYVVGLRVFGWTFPDGIIQLVLYQLLLVALPEEFFFRGYFQSTLDKIVQKKWRILGCDLGWSWIITALVFAFAHSVISYQWWHFSIFFPALLFGYLKEKTGSITAPILFHAASNIAMQVIAVSYR